jgi:1-acyl-sn-glycerol-3-phosphate acyltransferase
MDRAALLDRARTRGVNPVAYWLVRACLQPFFHVYLRLSRIGREHIPAAGPVILAANHRSFLDPFVIAVMARRPIYFVAKKELFGFHPLVSWLLGALGAFPIDRGAADQDAMATARAILERGDVVLMFPEGTRIRPGSLGSPKRGVGRLALETGAPVVPVAVIGTEAVRRGWRIRPHKVRIRAGRPLTFPRVGAPSPALAGLVTERIWPCVELQWEWLGGPARMRRAVVVGAGPAAAALAAALRRAGLEVDVAAPRADRDLRQAELVCFAVAPAALEAAVAGRVTERAAVVVLGPAGTPAPPAGRLGARAVATLSAAGDPAAALAAGGPLVLASADPALRAELRRLLRGTGLDVRTAAGPGAAWPADLSAPTTPQRRPRAA